MVGEGGLPPSYFLYEMSLAEVKDYVKGQDRRHRQGWEQTRVLFATQCDTKGKELTDIMHFAWDDEDEEELKESSEEEIKNLKENAMKFQALLNSAKKE